MMMNKICLTKHTVQCRQNVQPGFPIFPIYKQIVSKIWLQMISEQLQDKMSTISTSAVKTQIKQVVHKPL